MIIDFIKTSNLILKFKLLKKILFIIAIMIFNESYSQTLNPTIDGVWMGTYICAQGETGVRLTLNSINQTSFDGIFDFFPICSNYDKNVEVGKYYVIGLIDDSGNVRIWGRQWIWHPLDWFMVDLTGKLIGNTIEGNIEQQSCGNFKIVKQE